VNTRPLGSTGLDVTPLCIGTSALGSMPQLYGYAVDDAQARATLVAVFAGEVNFLDTSNGYADGASERRIGAVLADLGGLPRGFVLATKIDPVVVDGRIDFSGARARRSIEESLDRLGLDHLDLVYVHDPERISFADGTAPDGPVAALEHLRDEGTIGHIGVAGGPIDLLGRYVATGSFEVVITHNRYTLIDRSATVLFEACARAGVAVVNAAPFGGGMLAKGPGHRSTYAYREASRDLQDRVGQMEDACDRAGVPLAAAALQFSMREPQVTSTVVGVTRPERVSQAMFLANLEIPPELWDELERLAPPEHSWLG
jgi:D-threo-aldose 1-dehydrogenase